MTVPLPTPSNPKADAAVRKRRRRAPAGGAADDCFTCTKRGLKCDRRRPYCSQCLEVGNDCSGYKTQLTWGVGVASRGKLRGLSLPIAKSPPVQPVKKTSPSRARANSTAAGPNGANARWNDRESISPRSTRDVIIDGPVDHRRPHPLSLPTTPYLGYDLSKMSHPGDTSPSHSPAGQSWHNIPFPTTDGSRYPKLTPILAHHSHGPPEPLSSSIESLSDADYLSPLSHTFSRDDLPFVHSPSVMYAESYAGTNSPVPQSPVSAMMIDHQRAPTSCPSLVYAPSEPSSSLHSHHMDAFEAHLSNRMMEYEPLATPGLDAYSTSGHSDSHFWGQSSEDDTASLGVPEHHQPMPWPSVMEQPVLPVNPDLIAKMPFFLDYYEHTMCPGMVFIDGPNNPFREHILQLAANSRSLQHAICALAACNLRMKRRLSLGHAQDQKRMDGENQISDAQPDDRSLSEEYQHRNLAVHLLNEQLNDPAQSRHDSVLATILLLCHYRMAESGIAKFHTQFAGVKKILSMRRASPFPPSRDSAWMEALFTYFDAISASINDREAQLNTSFYGVMPDAQLLPAGAENLVGCDRELFKTIIKLGRLNLLSQHRPVQNLLNNTTPHGIPSRSQSPLASPIGHIYKPTHQYHLSGDMFSKPRFDGNGFSTTLEDEEMIASSLSSSTAYDDHRSTFWREWKDARIALQSWEYDPQRVAASLPGPMPPTSAQIRDLGSLSEAFRYAALLYTERLASPNVPSAHTNFRNLVSQVVYYATSLEAGSSAEKFLLWPLFVAGSECVNEMQQGIVRSKCREIMARSGYMNNLAALDVLERLWAGDWKEHDGPGCKLAGIMRRGPFSWAKCIGGPGVEVEWIMF